MCDVIHLISSISHVPSSLTGFSRRPPPLSTPYSQCVDWGESGRPLQGALMKANEDIILLLLLFLRMALDRGHHNIQRMAPD